MAVPYDSVGPGATGQELALLERAVGPIPESYSCFLLRHNGLEPAANVFMISPPSDASLRKFFSIAEALRWRDVLQAEIGDDFLPVGEAEGGNLVCLLVPDASVWYWDHDKWGRDGLTWLAPTVDDYLALLTPP